MDISKYDFKHNGIMKNSMQSIPMGNGDLGANVWAEKDGLYILLSKTDAWSELHRLLKTGLLHLQLTPNPFGMFTKWRLSYEEGVLYISANDVKIEIYVDANSPIYNLSYSSDISRKVKAEIINYRDTQLHYSSEDHSNFHMVTQGKPWDYECVESADCIFSETDNSIGQYHHNDTSCYEFTLDNQGLQDFDDKNDPLLNRTFGYLAFSDKMHRQDNYLTGANLTDFDIQIFSKTSICENTNGFVKSLYTLADTAKADLTAHKLYWKNMWQRCGIEITSGKRAYQLTEACIAQRYMNICAGRGAYPIKFNGSIFTNQPSPHIKEQKNYDYRLWGGPFWFQNTRLVYWSMLYLGDYDLMKPFFKLYIDALPMAKYQTKVFFGHEGAFLPETMTLFGTFTNKDYGEKREMKKPNYVPNPYVHYYFSGALELLKMMLDYAKYTCDIEFLNNEFYTFAKEILLFFKQHFTVKDGKLYICPTSSLETWQDCINDTPTIVGINVVANAILKCDDVPTELTDLCKELLAILPSIPFCKKKGKTIIAPFQSNVDKVRRNVENPELYTIFPYSYFGLGKDNLSVAIDTYNLRDIKTSGGWQQHGIQAAMLGLCQKAEKEAIHNCKNTNKKCIFPAFWGPNYDWLPDQDNGANLLMTIANMLVQFDDTQIRLLPAWNKKRNVKFRLPVGYNNFIEVDYNNGKLTSKLDKSDFRKIIWNE